MVVRTQTIRQDSNLLEDVENPIKTGRVSQDSGPIAVMQQRQELTSQTQVDVIFVRRGTASAQYISVVPPELTDALLDLYSIRAEAEADGGVVPDEDAIRRAERVLTAMFRMDSRPYSVYAMMDGDIVIDVDTPFGTKLLVICDTDGTARCVAYIQGEFTEKEYTDPEVIPDWFVVDSLLRAVRSSA